MKRRANRALFCYHVVSLLSWFLFVNLSFQSEAHSCSAFSLPEMRFAILTEKGRRLISAIFNMLSFYQLACE